MITKEASVAGESPSVSADRHSCPLCGYQHCDIELRSRDRFHGRERLYTLLRCSACAMVWLDQPPPKSEMSEHYGPAYDRTIAEAAKAPDHWFGQRDELLRYKSSGTVLDLGCASGGFLSTLKGPNWKLFGIEMSEEAARVARNRCGAEVFVGDVLDASFPLEGFDAVTCFHVFEHLYEPRAVLAKVSQWLKPGGVFYTSMPNFDSAGSHIFKSYWYALELPRHLYHFSPKTLRALAESAGLREVLLKTRRCLFFEPSVRYVIDDFLARIGISRPPLAELREQNRLPIKVVRRLFRLTLLKLFTAASLLFGDGEMMSAVFIKDGSSLNVSARPAINTIRELKNDAST